ncbi:Glycolipid transfer protein domain-containing protein [Cynara cardunculus var. scolymus]|uniref:Glycolipid transfer protein domain-containing protein n=1 Tax=Cynara cardunculus var. scolymus TaxID=59895 RepID=A0A103YNN7_CYNCS|nr:Glycolipid transfer protein domain-containing protein [Cynara cardunculus var. scolymus]
MEGTAFAPALEGMKNVKSEEGEMLSKPFLDVCKQLLPVIDQFGAAMALVEIEAKNADASSSCTNGLLWLTRAMDFIVELFRNLMVHADWSMSQLAMKLAPDRQKFMEVVGGTGDISSDIEKFCSTFRPLLEENHKFLASVGLDDLKAN